MKQEYLIVIFAIIVMLFYFIVATPAMNDDGFQYEGFTESVAQGHLDFRSFYGFQGLSFFAVPVFWLTHSHNSIIITSVIFSLLSLLLAYFVGKGFYGSSRAGIYSLILFLLMPYPYTTLMRGFQEAALLFFVLLILWGSLNKKLWTPIAWGIGGIVKPFALTLLPLFLGDYLSRKKIVWPVVAVMLGLLYLGANYHQTGHFVNDAAINSYQGNFDPGSNPPLLKSFTFGFKEIFRVGANLLVASRKIMISPFLIIIGVWSLLKNKDFKWRYKFIFSIILNVLLVSVLTFSFSKYLIPAVVLLALSAIPFLEKHKWAMWIVFADSLTVFIPIWQFFGHVFWSNLYIYLLPFWLAVALFIFYEYVFQKHYFNTNS